MNAYRILMLVALCVCDVTQARNVTPSRLKRQVYNGYLGGNYGGYPYGESSPYAVSPYSYNSGYGYPYSGGNYLYGSNLGGGAYPYSTGYSGYPYGSGYYGNSGQYY